MIFRYRMRALIRRPGLALASIAMLAIGIGANTVIYSVVHHLILRPLPVDDPDRIVTVWKTRENLGFFTSFDWREIPALRQATRAEAVEPYRAEEFVSTLGGNPEYILAEMVSDTFFNFAGASPRIGRGFAPEETQPGASPVVILSHDFWQSRFGGSTDVLGKDLELSGRDHEIIGVMPFGFRFPNEHAEVWLPLVIDAEDPPPGLSVMARIAPGASPEQLREELDGILAGFHGQGRGVRWEARLMTFAEWLGEDTRKALWLLFAAVGLVLLIACANAANLVFVHVQGRSGQMAIQRALGAGRRHLVSGILWEAAVLAAVGGLLGILLAVWGLELIRSTRPENLEQLVRVHINRPVLLFSIVACGISGLLAGLFPALKLSRPDLGQLILAAANPRSTSAHFLGRKALVALQIGLCTVLLIGSSLLVDGFLELRSTDPGYRAEGLVSARLSLPLERYSSLERRRQFFGLLKERGAALPGVAGAALGLNLPSRMGMRGGSLEIDGVGEVESPPSFAATYADADYFRVAGIPLVSGRAFRAGEKSVIVVNEQMEERYFPERGAVGQRIRFGGSQPWITIVGVSANVRAFGLADPKSRLQMYHPFNDFDPRSASLILRAPKGSGTLARQVRELVAELDPRLPVRRVVSAEAMLSESVERQRFSTLLFTLFALTGVVLAAIGLYGMVSHMVQDRTREFGIRMALGAQRRRILAMVVRASLALGGTGVLAGLVAAYWFNQVLTAQLSHAAQADPLTLAYSTLALLAIAAAAAFIPALRATRIDPMRALRCE